MELRKVVAIIRESALEKVEEALRDLGVPGISVSRVKGYGEYANFSKADWLVTNARVEVFAAASKAERIATAIMDAAHAGVSGDGIVAILPVEKLFSIRTKSEVSEADV